MYATRTPEKQLSNSKPDEEVIPVAVPPIIDQATFDAVQARMKARNPKVTPPQVVGGPTLLTGLIHCAKCGGAMTIRTGKGGRYRYYTCSTKARQGPTACNGMTVPMEKLDALVAGHLEDRLLDPARLEEVLATVLDRRQERTERRRDHIAELNKRATETDLRLKRLYDAIESGVADLDDPDLKDRIASLKATRDQSRVDADRASAMLESAGQKAITAPMLRKFAATARQRMRLDGGGYRRDHLRALAQRVEVNDGEVRIMGSKSDLLRTLAAAGGAGTLPGEVPSFVPKWRGAVEAYESAAHALRIAKAGAAGDLLDAAAFRQGSARGIDAEAFHGFSWGYAGVRCVSACERAWAHRGPCGEALDRKIGAEMIAHPGMQLSKARRVKIEQRRVLRLAAGALGVDHHLARNLGRYLGAEIRFDHGKRQIDAGGYASGRPHLTVLYINAISFDAHVREEARKLRGAAPVRRRLLAVEQARRGKDERAGADAGDAARACRRAFECGQQRLVFHRCARAAAAGYDQRIDARAAECLRRHRNARGGGDDAGFGRRELQRIGARRKLRCDLKRPDGAGDIDDLKAGKDHDFDHSRLWRKKRLL